MASNFEFQPPVVEPTPAEVEKALSIRGLSPERTCCAYCGDPHTEWDHLNPIVKDRKPTGFITEIRNLVPSCGKCNQSKGNKDWAIWMRGSARHSPGMRKIQDIDERSKRLADFVVWGRVEPLPLELIVEPSVWNRHWAYLDAVEQLFREADSHFREVGRVIRTAMSAQKLPDRTASS
ncbi:MAG: HNH endonuclease [Alphaproteobacteria bacterium]|nr:HNH endonuclease [Alphaproteobacteria bacterium]